MTLIIQGKLPKENKDNSFRDVEENEVDSRYFLLKILFFLIFKISHLMIKSQLLNFLS